MDASVPKHRPQFTLNNKILSQVAEISEAVGRLSVVFEHEQSLKLRRISRMRTIQGSLAIEGSNLSESWKAGASTQITTQKTTQNQQEILEYLNKHPLGSPQEIANAITTFIKNGVKNNLKVLQEKGLLKRVVFARAGHWKVIDRNVLGQKGAK